MSLKTEVWSSKWVFILAAIGAAAGLGNLWRFPYLTYDNGGAAFLFAYIICLVFLAKPIMMVEIAMAQKLKADVLGSLGHAAGRPGRFFGWTITGIIAGLAGYYAAIIAWGWDFLAASPNLAWGNDAQVFFHERILNLSEGAHIWGGISWPIVAGLLLTYAAVYFSIFKGVVSVGKVVKWTVPLPFILLFILFLNATTLEGSMTGFAYFLVPEWGLLSDPNLWKDAVTMSFFSTNVGLALTMTYAQFNKKEDVVHSAWMISLGDLLVSFIAGLAMFGTLGYMAVTKGVAIDEVIQSGPTLAFVTIPTALAELPFAAGFFAVLFFAAILTLAIDSMFAVIETIISSFRTQFKSVREADTKKVVLAFCTLFFLFSLSFAGGNGLYRLDIIDHFLFSHLFYLTITAFVIIAGWAFPVSDLRRYINMVSKHQLGVWFDYLIKYVAPVIFVGLYLASLPAELKENYEGYSNEAILWWGIFPIVLILGVSWILSKDKES